jgi:hypothetical protein
VTISAATPKAAATHFTKRVFPLGKLRSIQAPATGISVRIVIQGAAFKPYLPT